MLNKYSFSKYSFIESFFILFLFLFSTISYSNEWHGSSSAAFAGCNSQFPSSTCVVAIGVPNVTCASGSSYKFFWTGDFNQRHFFCPSGYATPNVACPYQYSDGSCGNTPEITLPTCSSIGYDDSPSTIYPSGFCSFDNSGVLQASPSTCLSADQSTVNVPTCQLSACPDGSYINSSFQTCPTSQQCWDGSTVPVGSNCPTPPFTCPDGSHASSQSECASPDSQLHHCWNGTQIPLETSCPLQPEVTCSDGSTAANSLSCPSPTTLPVTCQDGSVRQNISECPAINNIDNSVNDSSTTTSNSTSNSTSTTTNTDGSTSSTTTITNTTTTETVDINLDAVNSRLDKINKTLDDLGKGDKGNGGSIYSKSGKTFGGATAAFMTAMSNSSLMNSVSDVFTININQNVCPFWTLPSVMGLPSFVIDHHCRPFMDNVFLLVSGVLLLVATMTSIRIMLAG